MSATLQSWKAPPTFLTFDPDPSVQAYRNASATGNMDFKPSPGVRTHHLHGSPVFWASAAHGPMLFAWGENSELRAFALDASGRVALIAHGAEIASAQLARASNGMGGMPGAMLTLSANNGEAGVVWVMAPVDGDANMEAAPGIVRAYDASRFDPAPGGGHRGRACCGSRRASPTASSARPWWPPTVGCSCPPMTGGWTFMS